MNVTVDELREFALQTLAALELVEGNEMDLTVEDYWDTFEPERYNAFNPSQELGLGNLVEDMEELRRTLPGGDGVATRGHLLPLSEVLRAIGDTVGRSPGRGGVRRD